MTTLFDYKVIESVYSGSFIRNSKIVETDFLESTSIQIESPIKQYTLPADYSTTTTSIWGKQIIAIKRESTVDLVLNAIEQLPMEISAITELGVYCFRSNIPYHFGTIAELKSDKLDRLVFFKREEILLSFHAGKLDGKELLQRIDLGKKYKEFK